MPPDVNEREKAPASAERAEESGAGSGASPARKVPIVIINAEELPDYIGFPRACMAEVLEAMLSKWGIKFKIIYEISAMRGSRYFVEGFKEILDKHMKRYFKLGWLYGSPRHIASQEYAERVGADVIIILDNGDEEAAAVVWRGEEE